MAHSGDVGRDLDHLEAVFAGGDELIRDGRRACERPMNSGTFPSRSSWGIMFEINFGHAILWALKLKTCT